MQGGGLEPRLNRAGDDSEDVGYQKWEGEKVSRETLRRAVAMGDAEGGTLPVLEPSLRESLLDSEEERRFLEWACTGARARRGGRLLPQVRFGDLGTGSKDMRRADFVYSDGVGQPIVIEIDGLQHEDSKEADASRDEALEALGLDVRRIPASALQGSGDEDAPELKYLDGILEKSADNLQADDDQWAQATRWIQEGVALQAALTSLWVHGAIQGAENSVRVSGRLPAEVWRAAVDDWMALAQAIIDAHGLTDVVQRPQPNVVPDEETEEEDSSRKQILIVLETEQPWWHGIPDTKPDFVIRRCAPVETALLSSVTNPKWSQWKKAAKETSEAAEETSEKVRDDALGWLLQAAFRKRRFREAQSTAIRRWMDGKDTIVLLPTGAGKSMIYQLAGLISPGTTLVVAPLVALMNDQREGLEQSGIRRMKALSSEGQRKDETDAIREIRNGSLIFLAMAPERLQKPEWCQALGTARKNGGIAGAVIDEGHCISEWGHDFRPAYGQLGSRIKGKLGFEAVLVLTGTASRAVYWDMVAHMEVDREDPGACIRPSTHDRPEIHMSLKYCKSPRDADLARPAALSEVLRCFPPGKPEVVFRPQGKKSRCGIIFMPAVRGRSGIAAGLDLADGAGLRAHAVTYAGGEYQQDRAKNARQFKRNRATVMVATGGYGMGVDKPNVRWVVHPHLTGSLESYYQQIGRAGRDGKQAYASAVLHDEDPEHTDRVLGPRASFDEAKEVHEQRQRKDDVGTALFFHFDKFKGAEAETRSLLDTISQLDRMGALEIPREYRLAYSRDRVEDEKTRDQKTLERDVVRLIRLGIVKYYEIHYGSMQMSVYVPKWSVENMLQGLKRYIERFDRARAKVIDEYFRAELERRQASVKDIVKAGCRRLVSYLYEKVEPARRRALYETVQMARACSTDAEIRRRMLDYLSEGKGSETVDRLLREVRFDRPEWWKEWHRLFGDIDSMGQMEAGRVQGLFIRALESNPGHPALLMGRAIAESACKDAAIKVVIENIRAAVEALPRYVRETGFETAMNGMVDWIERAEGDGLGPLCTLAWLMREARFERSEWWQEWHRLFGDIDGENQMEAERVRRIFILALESNPGHPALLMGRAIAESACKNGRVKFAIDNIQAAVDALPRYAREAGFETAMNGVFEWIERADGDGLGPLCALAWLSRKEMDEGGRSRLTTRASQWHGRAYMTELNQIERLEEIIGKVEEAQEMIRTVMNTTKGPTGTQGDQGG